MKTNRRLNVEAIDQAIISKGWTFSAAAARIGIAKASLSKVYNGKNVNNKVILRISQTLNIPLNQLVTWPTNGNHIPQG